MNSPGAKVVSAHPAGYAAAASCLLMVCLLIAGCIPSPADNSPQTSEKTSTAKSSSSSSANSPATMPVRLSAGTSLPQTLPNGTSVAFSVDYEVNATGLDGSEKYVWVIERNGGTAHRQVVQLAQKGTLQAITPFRPEQGPFRSYLSTVAADQSEKRISQSVEMR